MYKRYMVVEHPKSKELTETQPLHSLMGGYHWARLDDNHIFLYGDYSIQHHDEIHNNAKVSVLPMIGSVRCINSHIKNAKHLAIIKNSFQTTDEHNIEDLVDKVVAKHGNIFLPK